MASTKDVIDHHLTAFGAGDLDEVMSDYASDAVMFMPDTTVKGSAAIRPIFQAMFAEFAKPGATFELLHQAFDGEYCYQRWRAETADNLYDAATDSFVVHAGQIVAQSFNAVITPKGKS